MRGALLSVLLFSGCTLPQQVLCLPCEGECGFGLECVQGVCVSEVERCGINDCGGGPPCADGFECFEGSCETPVEVDGGGYHACVRWRSGRVSCWGANAFGQCGEGPTYQLTPAVIAGIDSAVDIALGDEFSCALLADGHAQCWGNNLYGQLGNFNTELARDLFRSENSPQDVFIEEPLVRLEAQGNYACAIGASGRLHCWGWGGAGCLLGDESSADSQLPLEIAHQLQLDDISIGGSHTVVRSGGHAYGLGDNSAGQIGGTDPKSCSFRELGLFEETGAVSAGVVHTCAVDARDPQRVACIGSNTFLEAPGELSFMEPVDELQMSNAYSCVRLRSSGIMCFGYAGSAQLGWDPTGDLEGGPPTLIQGTAGAKQIATGTSGFICFLREGDGVYCWGNGLEGELGNGKSGASSARRVAAGDFANVVQGATQTCALEKSGRVLCWGRNEQGQIGRGRRSFVEDPAPVEGIDAIALTAGNSFVCALDRSHQVWCWGRYDALVLGLTGTPRYVEPVRIDGASGATAISSGADTVCAILANEEVACWGVNVAGIVRAASWEVIEEPVHMPRIASPVGISVGSGHACVFDASGAIDCWGLVESYGQDQQLDGLKQLAIGAGFSCALRSLGEVWCWGDNSVGQLGNGTTRSSFEPSRVRELPGAVEVDTLFNHTCALVESGDVHCWGQDFLQGRLGLGPTYDRVIATKVPGLPAGRALTVGRSSACIVAADGIWCWGFDVGQFDAKPQVTRTPSRVIGLR